MPISQYDFYLDAGADWHRVVRMRDPETGDLIQVTDAVMEIRNTNFVLALRLDAPSGRCVIDSTDGASINLHISAQDSLTYFRWGNYPGAVQAVGFWGIGRAYLYDLFANYTDTGLPVRLLRGFFHVDPNITQVDDTVNPMLTIGTRGSNE